jgi:hypothetical protein
MYTARFLFDIYEEKYAINPYYSWGFSQDGNWHLGEEYNGVSFSIGHKTRSVMRYIKLKKSDVVLHNEEINIILEHMNKVRINNEIITITSVVKNLDGSIDYYTDKKEYVPLNTRDTYFDERPKQEETPIRLEGKFVYE